MTGAHVHDWHPLSVAGERVLEGCASCVATRTVNARPMTPAGEFAVRAALSRPPRVVLRHVDASLVAWDRFVGDATTAADVDLAMLRWTAWHADQECPAILGDLCARWVDYEAGWMRSHVAAVAE